MRIVRPPPSIGAQAAMGVHIAGRGSPRAGARAPPAFPRFVLVALAALTMFFLIDWGSRVSMAGQTIAAGGSHNMHWAAQQAERQYERATAQLAAQQSREHAAAADEQPVQRAAAARKPSLQQQQQRSNSLHQPAGAAADAAAVVKAVGAAEPSLVEALPRYSTHTCIGGKPEDNWHSTTCKFDNVCLDAATGQFEYYLDPAIVGDLPVAHHQVNGAPLDQFPEHLLNMGHAHISQDDSMGWRPVVKREAFPQEGPHMRWAPVQQALVTAIAPMLTDNFGHVMYDLLVPLFSMQQLFRVYTPDAQILITAAVKGSREELEAGLRKFINTDQPEKSLARLTWDHEAAWVRAYAREVLGGQDQGRVCFKTVLAGTGMLSRQLARVDSLPYRQAAVQHIGLQEAPQRQPVITILKKAEGRRRVENSGEIAALLRLRYPAAKVHTVSFDRRPDLTVTEQVKLMSDTSILVTPCGGLATVLTFLRPGATAIAMNYWHSLQQRSLQLEDNYYSHLEYLDLQYMPVTPEDYAATSDRPGCELVEGGPLPQDAHYPLLGALVHCNLRLAPAGLRRLVRYVDAAMLRWAAAHGRYDVLPPPTDPLVVTEGGDGGLSSSSSMDSSSSNGHASSGQAVHGQDRASAQPLAGLPQQQHTPEAADAAQQQERVARQPRSAGGRQLHRKEGGLPVQQSLPK